MNESTAPHPSAVSPANIWQFAQNKPSLVVADLAEFDVPPEAAYSILMARGVCKWLAVRRDLIRLKDVWRVEICKTIDAIRAAKRDGDWATHMQLKGRIKTFVACRQAVRRLCHSERWTMPDHDSAGQWWLEKVTAAKKTLAAF